jgi:deoxyribodipyrimidine photo-lyase
MINTSIFLFHRDFRTIDNTSLKELSNHSDVIIPIFIYTPEQVSPSQPYYNEKSISHMTKSLHDIPHLQVFYGDTKDVLESLFKKNKINYIGFNYDYTPYARERTEMVKKLAKKYDVTCITKEDYTLLPVSEYRDGGVYKVFKAFYDRLLSLEIPLSKKEIKLSNKKLDISSKYSFEIPKKSESQRKKALQILKDKKLAKKYSETRNFPSIETTHLSKYIKYGSVSIREVYHAFKDYDELLRQVIWHDFYACLMYYLPEKDTIGGGNVKHLKIKWKNSKKLFKAWCEGKTGFPIIDAGMRQLNETGWMHNRVRLLTSNFLSLILKIDWRWGEQYFAQKLIDYDITSNNLNWQFSVQVGTDRAQFLRVYNPFNQSLKYDKDCIYIKKWVPELKDIKESDIHKNRIESEDYPKPIVNIEEEMKSARKIYKG